MKLRAAVLLSVILCADLIVQAQTSSDFSSFILPSPNAMTFQKYVDYPVDHSTGMVDISVPLYTIKVKDYNFPITASFHASGRSTALNFSPLGMNWALMASGMISVEVRGRPDSKGYPHVEKSASDYSPQSSHYNDLLSADETIGASPDVTIKDSEYDIYTISINGISAKFIRNDDRQMIFLTWCPYKILFPGDAGSGGQFVVTDDNGYVYKFGSDGAGNGGGETDASTGGPSSWFIASITTPGNETITFKYGSTLNIPGSFTFLGNRIYRDLGAIKDCDNFNSNCVYNGGSGQSFFDNQVNPLGFVSWTNDVVGDNFSLNYITEIDFPNGKVNFAYDDTPDNLLLDSVTVTNLQNDIIRIAHFDYYLQLPGTDLVLPNNNSTTVQNIIFRDNTNADVEKYSFEYYPGVAGGTLPDFAKAKDYWGYCNDMPSGGNSWGLRHIPFTSVNIQTAAGGTYTQSTFTNADCHKPLFDAKLPGMIKTIHFPTGGTADYTYEKNVYLNYQGVETDGPGIRVKEIFFKDGYGKTLKRKYTYAPGYVVREPLVDDYFTETRPMLLQDHTVNGVFSADFVGSYRKRTYSSEPVPAASIADRYPVYYNGVTVADYSDDDVPNGSTTYSYSNASYTDGAISATSPATCNCSVTLTIGGNEFFSSRVFVYNEFSKPQLNGVAVNKYDPVSASFRLVSSTGYTFSTMNQVTIPQSSLYRFVEMPLNTDYNTSSTGAWYPQIANTAPYQWQMYNVMDKPLISAVIKPVRKSVDTYDDNGNLMSSVTNYYYDNPAHLNPTRTTTTTSDGRILTSYVTYAQDYPAGTAFIDGLVSRNMVSEPIEQVQTSTTGGTTKIESGKLTTYTGAAVNQVWRTESATPIAQAAFKLSNRTLGTLPPTGSASAFGQDGSYTSRLTYNVYDSKNNPLTVTPTNNYPIAYQWGYNQMYPTVEVHNAPNKDVFYTGFEEGDGNSTSGDSKAGLYSHTGTAYSKNLTGLDNGNYILSYWQKSGAIWSLATSIVPVTTGSYTVSLGSGLQVDELRFYPATATMKTFTFQPLVGMTSECDEKDMFTYYEYDGFGRLAVIRDKDRNIIKSLCYDLQGVSNNCEVFWNGAQSGSFMKSNCDCTAQGQTVSFSVPAHTYHAYSQSAADNLALNYILANGQSYADAQSAETYCTNLTSQTINYVNNVNDVICVTFTNTCTNTPYSYTLNAHTTTTTNLATLPAGKYDISIGECSHSRPYSFTIGSNSASNTTNANFSNVIFTSTTTIYVN